VINEGVELIEHRTRKSPIATIKYLCHAMMNKLGDFLWMEEHLGEAARGEIYVSYRQYFFMPWMV